MLYGTIIRKSRKAIGMSQKELAAAVYTNQCSIGQWERNDKAIPDYVLPLINKTLGLNLKPMSIGERSRRISQEWRHRFENAGNEEFLRGFDAGVNTMAEILQGIECEYRHKPRRENYYKKKVRKGRNRRKTAKTEENQNRR